MKIVFGKKALALTTVACAAAFVAVGYSAWYVSGPTQYNFSGNVEIADIRGSIADVDVPEEQLSQVVVYGSPLAAEDADTWLSSDGENNESLTLSYTFTFTGVAREYALSMSVGAEDSKGEEGVPYESPFGVSSDRQIAGYAKAVEAGYISDAAAAKITVTLPSEGISHQKPPTGGDMFTFSGEYESYTAQVEITFAWGQFFDGKNPYEKYKDLTDADAQKEASDTLAYIAACLEGVRYVVTFTPFLIQ